MKAGQTKLDCGTRAKIKGITHKNDKCLNGLTGEITHPFAFGCTEKGWIGFISDDYSPYGYHFNVKESEIEIL